MTIQPVFGWLLGSKGYQSCNMGNADGAPAQGPSFSTDALWLSMHLRLTRKPTKCFTAGAKYSCFGARHYSHHLHSRAKQIGISIITRKAVFNIWFLSTTDELLNSTIQINKILIRMNCGYYLTFYKIKSLFWFEKKHRVATMLLLLHEWICPTSS